MSRHPPTTPLPLEREFVESLELPSKLADLVRKLLEMREEDAKRAVGGTTRTGFRRVHEQVSSAIDRSLEILSRGVLDERSIYGIITLFTRGLILVNYQEARDQIDKGLASRIKVMINHVIETVKTKNVERIRNVLESTRTLMDALVVLVYKHAR